jgi:hypothetical protein
MEGLTTTPWRGRYIGDFETIVKSHCLSRKLLRELNCHDE